MTQPPNPSDDIPSAGPGGPPPPPPAGAYPPPGGFPPPGGGYPPPGPAAPPPPGYASSDDKTWVLIAHFGGALGMVLGAGAGGWVAPLVALLVQGNKSPQVRAHAVGALNFQLVLSIIGAIGLALSCAVIGFIIWPIAMILGIVFGVIAGVKANEGQFYQYPFNISLVK
jgi:uncharacterized protein